MSPLIGIDEICDLKDDQKVLLCRFILVNDPYNLKLKLTQYKNLKCIQEDLTLINMYRCPFAIQNANGEMSRETSYLIARGEDKTKAIIFRQDNLEIDFWVDAVVYDCMEIKRLENIINAGLLTKEGRKYLSHHGGGDSEVQKMVRRYLEFLHSDKGKLEYT